jgi:integrase
VLALKKMEGKTADEIYDLLEVKKNPRFSRFAKEYLSWSKSDKKSWKRDELSLKHLTAFFGDKRLRNITRKNVDSYKHHRQQDARSPKGSTINRELACLKHLFNLAIQYKEASENPVRGMKYFKENTTAWQYLNEEETNRLIEYCPDDFRPIVITALNTAMRKNEILGLRWFDVDFQLAQITVRETKSGEPRYIPVNSTLTEVLDKVRLISKSEHSKTLITN